MSAEECKHFWNAIEDNMIKCDECGVYRYMPYYIKDLEEQNAELEAQNADYEALGVEHQQLRKENAELKNKLIQIKMLLKDECLLDAWEAACRASKLVPKKFSDILEATNSGEEEQS